MAQWYFIGKKTGPRFLHGGQRHPLGKSLFSGFLKPIWVRWIEIYPVESPFHPRNDWGLFITTNNKFRVLGQIMVLITSKSVSYLYRRGLGEISGLN